jgi:hypothetical protein
VLTHPTGGGHPGSSRVIPPKNYTNTTPYIEHHFTSHSPFSYSFPATDEIPDFGSKSGRVREGEGRGGRRGHRANGTGQRTGPSPRHRPTRIQRPFSVLRRNIGAASCSSLHTPPRVRLYHIMIKKYTRHTSHVTRHTSHLLTYPHPTP